VERAIREGAGQVLVLGAGFDTLCLRLAPQHRDVQFFEVDHPATSEAKARGVALVGRPENMLQIAADLGERPLSKVLSEDGRWEPSRRSVLVAEGLLQYLEDEDVRGLLAEAGTCATRGSRIVFTHAVPDRRRVLQMVLRVVGEPFRSALRSEDLPGYVEGTGWVVISDVDTDPAHGIERYAVAEQR
jgi:methyltransferase (TIGR00027 family)